jgi:hypothetical protein
VVAPGLPDYPKQGRTHETISPGNGFISRSRERCCRRRSADPRAPAPNPRGRQGSDRQGPDRHQGLIRTLSRKVGSKPLASCRAASRFFCRYTYICCPVDHLRRPRRHPAAPWRSCVRRGGISCGPFSQLPVVEDTFWRHFPLSTTITLQPLCRKGSPHFFRAVHGPYVAVAKLPKVPVPQAL